tara:strand:- start:1479 stop:2201 length:723 start_codon:yes stop_codon:yes gene_type:complete
LFFLVFCSKNNHPAVSQVQQQTKITNTDLSNYNLSGSYRFFHAGQDRIYHYYQPLNLPKNSPLVFVLHGDNSNVKDFVNLFQMIDLAEEHSFVLVYPQGLKDDTLRTHWNPGLTLSDVDDVGFLSELALYLQKTYSLNPSKTFTSGYSNGGFMSYELIVRKPEIFKAAASILGTMSLETSNNRSLAQATPILQLSGKLDQIVPVNGLMGLYGGWGGAPKILDNMEYWAELNKYDVKEFLQ